jgi:DNA-binding transcriptional regulator YdaS (Cro superfamily)
MLVDPGQLRLLALIERHGSLSAAATALGLTPAAVTQQVTITRRRPARARSGSAGCATRPG